MKRISTTALIAVLALITWGATHYPSTGGKVAYVCAFVMFLWDLLK